MDSLDGEEDLDPPTELAGGEGNLGTPVPNWTAVPDRSDGVLLLPFVIGRNLADGLMSCDCSLTISVATSSDGLLL